MLFAKIDFFGQLSWDHQLKGKAQYSSPHHSGSLFGNKGKLYFQFKKLLI
jgi:hypothetical protein